MRTNKNTEIQNGETENITAAVEAKEKKYPSKEKRISKKQAAAKPQLQQDPPADNPREDTGKILNSLEGNVDEVEKELEGDSEQSENGLNIEAPLIKNRKAFFAAGLIILILSVIGLVTAVKFSVNTVSDIVNRTSLKNEFAEFIYPLVLIDTPAFESTADAPASVIINSAIWRITLSGKTDKYENDGTNMYISEIDVESAAAAIFGYGIKIEHQTVSNGTDTFEYNASTKSYAVPVKLDKNTYWPKINSISNIGETFTLIVDYMPPMMGVNMGNTTADKQMIFVVSRTASSMTVKSIQYVDTESTQ